MTDMSKRFNATLRHSVGCVKDKKGYPGLPCDSVGWVNVEALLKYDDIWRDREVLAGTKTPDFNVTVKRWDLFQRIIFTEYKHTHRVRAQVLALKVTKGESEKIIGKKKNKFTDRIDRGALRLEIRKSDSEIWLWPAAVRAPMEHQESRRSSD